MDYNNLLGTAAEGLEELLSLPHVVQPSRGRQATVQSRSRSPVRQSPAPPPPPSTPGNPTVASVGGSSAARLKVLTNQVDVGHIAELYKSLSSTSPGAVVNTDGTVIQSRNVSPSPPRDSRVQHTHLDLSPVKPLVTGGHIPASPHRRIQHVDEGDAALEDVIQEVRQRGRITTGMVNGNLTTEYVDQVTRDRAALQADLEEKSRALKFCSGELAMSHDRIRSLEATVAGLHRERTIFEAQAGQVAELEASLQVLRDSAAAERAAAASARDEDARLRMELDSMRRLLARHEDIEAREEQLRNVEKDFLLKVSLHEELLQAASVQEKGRLESDVANAELAAKLATACSENAALRSDLLDLRGVEEHNRHLVSSAIQHEMSTLALEESFFREMQNTARLQEISDIRLEEARGRAAMYAALFELAAADAGNAALQLQDGSCRSAQCHAERNALRDALQALQSELRAVEESRLKADSLLQGEASELSAELHSLRQRLAAAQEALADKEAELTAARKTVFRQNKASSSATPKRSTSTTRRTVPDRRTKAQTQAQPAPPTLHSDYDTLTLNMQPRFHNGAPWVPPPGRASPPRWRGGSRSQSPPREVNVVRGGGSVTPARVEAWLEQGGGGGGGGGGGPQCGDATPTESVDAEDLGHTPGRATTVQRLGPPPL